MISATALRYFAEVTRSGSYRAAAEKLCIAPSAISRHILLLEQEIGAPLLERGRGRSALRLTAAGEILMQYTITIDSEMDRVRSDIEALKGERKGHIRLGVPETFARDFMPEFLARFNQRFPGITYYVEVAGSTRLVEMVGNGELDLSLTFNPPAAADVRHIYTREVPTCALVHIDHPLAGRESLRLSDLAEYGIAMPEGTISAKRLYDDMFAKARIRPRRVLSSNSYELLRSVSKAGMSIAIVSEHPAFGVERPAFHRQIPIVDRHVPHETFTVCVREGRSLPIIGLTFIDHLLKELEAMESST
jgi:DNA-binding transcriptional LysR family regulator